MSGRTSGEFPSHRDQEKPVQPRETLIPKEALTRRLSEPSRPDNTVTGEIVGVPAGVPVPPTGGGIADLNPMLDGRW